MTIKYIVHWIGESTVQLPDKVQRLIFDYFTVIEHEDITSVLASSHVSTVFFYFKHPQQQALLDQSLEMCETFNKKLIMIHHGLCSKLCLQWIHTIKASIDLSRTDLPEQKIHELFASLSQQINKKSHRSRENAQQSLEKLMFDILHYIDNNIDHELKEDEVSAYFNYTPNYFSKVFNQAAGTGFKAYITNKRIAKAKEMLIHDQDANIAQIAYQCGYKDVSYFSRVFKKKTGITPGYYRQQNETAEKRDNT
ncbi:helix-turn-helix domain-containing protein [Vibrio quintilis]|uniref:HTH-type transcriptional activator Btr n=1 Tax=Vibrio quintilis TaxID=1117707 RepID=A0A1M7YS62_9VIBR|nr:AraC family transcriptional regulator [Vibrio quintilis]SHO55464.1 HTH-type transcriptional activator Btr [Vibrio quintilis]